MAGAADLIIRSLSAHDFRWAGEVRYQSNNLARFESVVDGLLADGFAFPCTCSRAQIRDAARLGNAGPIYPGTCREKSHPEAGKAYAVRLRVTEQRLFFNDRLLGRVEHSIASDIGDFIVRRKDRLIAYVLAVVIDDYDQGITEIVRGVDLLNFTPAQVYLQRLLDFNTPEYMHLPVAINATGQKLSKQAGALPIDDSRATENLVHCLEFLKQSPPGTLAKAPVQDVWAWAKANWHPERLLRHTSQQ